MPTPIENNTTKLQALLAVAQALPEAPSGTIEITENGTVDVASYVSAAVNVPNPSAGSLNITANGTYDVTTKAQAVVNVPTPEPVLQNKSATPSETQQIIRADSNYDGLAQVTVAAIQTEQKTATANGVITPSSGKYLTQVTVAIPNGDEVSY